MVREFDRNPNWSKETLLEVSRKTGLSEAQVYKWGWDQKRKKYGPEAAALMMPPFESLGYNQGGIFDLNFEQMQEQKELFNTYMSKPFPEESLAKSTQPK